MARHGVPWLSGRHDLPIGDHDEFNATVPARLNRGRKDRVLKVDDFVERVERRMLFVDLSEDE